MRFNFKEIKQDATKQANITTPTTTKATNTRSLDCLINLTYKKDDKLVRLARIDKDGAYYKAWFDDVDNKGGFFVNIKDYDYFMDYLLLNGFIKQDKPMISEVKSNQAETPVPFKENDALIRFKNAIKRLNKDKPNPTITPTVKNANNKQIQANNEILTKFENIVLTSPKYFDYTIKSVTKGSLYYEINAFCDLKKKHEMIRLLVAEYSKIGKIKAWLLKRIISSIASLVIFKGLVWCLAKLWLNDSKVCTSFMLLAMLFNFVSVEGVK